MQMSCIWSWSSSHTLYIWLTFVVQTRLAMATTVFPVKSVQEIALAGEEPPSEYIIKTSTTAKLGPLETSCPLAPVPIIDTTSLFSSSDTKNQEAELAKLKSALTTWGCFQAVNHGIPDLYLDKLRQVVKQFFALPPEEKRRYSRQGDVLEGYGGDPAFSEDQALDWADYFFLTVFPEDHRNLHFWPQNPSDLRETLVDYTMKLQKMSENLLVAMARSLEIEEDSFLKQYSLAPVMAAQFNLYPPCRTADKTLGLKPHSDGSTITLLLQDKQVEGLQVLKDGQWLQVPIIPDAIFINIGDQMEIMSNGMFKSPMHRVVTNAEKKRMSLPVFCKTEKEVEPLEELISNERPRLYKKITLSKDFYFQCYQQGKLPIDAAKI